MGTAAVRGTRTLQRRRIIQRPRLLALLDASNARVRMLIAAAGYGKTTLAEQWVATDERRSAWYTVRRASVDVSGLALGLARACSVVVGGCDERLRAHLKAVSASTGSSTVLAEILCEDLAEWPSNAWLVIDDYQEISGSKDAESLVADLVSGCPLQILVTSRQRPSWVNARSILYGDVLEVGQASLAMDPQEAAEVLADWSGPATSGLVALADGWPAVIGLASVSSAEIDGDGDATVPESLYRFFAEEVYDALGEEVRDGLTLLAVAPVLDRGLADELLGEEQAELVCSTALEIGLLVERDSRLELHPLARSFLEERPAVLSRPALATCLARYRAARDWDAAFDLIVRREAPQELEGLLEAALDDLLDSARLATIEDWCEFAKRSQCAGPISWLARAEVLLRRGHHIQAQARAEAAAVSRPLSFRALALAGRAAHLASREEVAREVFRRAYESAANPAERRNALWGKLLCEIELELKDAEATFHELAKDVRPSDPADFVRAAASSVCYALRFGRLEFSSLDVAYELLSSVDDALISSSFLSGYAQALALATRYDHALEAAGRLLTLAEEYRLDFAIPYARLPAAIAHAGRREWQSAGEQIHEARRLAAGNRDVYADQSGYSVQVRVLTQQGRYLAAVSEPAPDLDGATPAQQGEVIASRALALAASGHPEQALALVTRVRNSTRAVEPQVLVAAVDAIAASRGGRIQDLSVADRLVVTAVTTGGLDLLVTAYRSCPELLPALLRSKEHAGAIVAVVKQVGDDDLAQQHGLLAPDDADPRVSLTPREREIYNLLLERLSNRQIADLLVIETSTVKAHTHRIYEKLGVHSRSALAIQAALRRVN